MTTVIDFRPGTGAPFQFTADIGGATAFATVFFNHYSRRYYLKLANSSGETVVFRPLVGSPEDYDINLALPFSSGSLVFREGRSQFEVR